MIKVLFLSQWYPNRYDKMFGLFVQKHAEAVSLYCDVRVLYLHADNNVKKIEIVKESNSKLSELIVYYPSNSDCVFHKITNLINYFRAFIKGYKEITRDGFAPDIVHANVLTRTGFIAYLLKKWKKTPYVITEHWTRYLPEIDSYKGILRVFITKKVVSNASAVLPVSNLLVSAMQALKLKNSNYIVVDNVVDDVFFKDIPTEKRLKKRILHISCFYVIQKNISGILRATLALSKIRNDFEFVIIGNGIDFDKLINYAKGLNFQSGILNFIGEKSSADVAKWLHNSDFFLLFSNYETAGVIIAESLVCGKPVLSTRVGAAPDYINNKNGVIIPIGDEKILVETMSFLLDNLENYKMDEIKSNAKSKFSYESVGSKINDIYKQTLGNS